MADNVQWIKLKVGMFDGNSFKKIKRAKIGGVSYRDKLTAIWFELLDLAGKSNANGYLIDNNEIPYHSFEDIAIMLDREENEIELCMQFFINEKMIEIIDDIYCLTNFTKYQNEDGLNKIREQKRIAQAKWRERKKLGLIEYNKNVDKNLSTVDTTNNLPSYIDIDKDIDNISKKESNNINNKEEDMRACVRESYDSIFEDFGVSKQLKDKFIEFIRHCQLNGKMITNDKLKDIIVRLDMAYDDDVPKIQSLKKAINGGYFDIAEK